MPRKSRSSLTGLIALNAALLAALGFVALAPKVTAQNRARSSFTMVAGNVKGQVPPVVYIVDESTAELVGVSWDESRKQLVGMGYRNLTTDATEVARVRN